MSTLKSQAKTCNFGALQDELTRDRLVCGINSKSVRCALLKDTNLSPAFGQVCHKCKKQNHFKKQCRSSRNGTFSKQVNQLATETDSDSEDTFTVEGLSLHDESVTT